MLNSNIKLIAVIITFIRLFIILPFLSLIYLFVTVYMIKSNRENYDYDYFGNVIEHDYLAF